MTAVIEEDGNLVVELGRMRVSIDLAHGAHIHELTDVSTGVNLLYQDPAGSRAYRVGAWYELFPNAGGACEVGGRRLSVHGDVQRQPWLLEKLDRGPDSVTARMSTRSEEMPIRLTRTMRMTGAGTVHIDETVENESDEPAPFLWGHHVTFGEVMMSPSCRIEPPDVEFRAWSPPGVDEPYDSGARGRLDSFPGIGGALLDLRSFDRPPYGAMLFADITGDGRCALAAPDLGLRAEVEWDVRTFRSLWIWLTTRGTVQDPEIVACAIEPQTSPVPKLAHAIEAGTADLLGPGERRSTWVRVSIRPLGRQREAQLPRADGLPAS